MRSRLFLAVGLSDDVRHGLAVFIGDQPSGLPGRPTPPANWHLTVRFLGTVSPVERDRILGFLDEHLAIRPFTLGFAGLGAFPKPARATVLWLGVDRGSADLRRVAAVCEEAAVAAGLEREERPFHAHVTLARLRPPANVVGLIEAVAPFPLVMEVDRVTLFRSDLGPDGARYHPVDEVLL